MQLLEIMAALYDSEINCSLSSFWDGGFTLALGDTVNGWKETALWWPPSQFCNDEAAWLNETGWQEMAEWLHAMVLKHYPDSDYALADKVSGQQVIS